MTLSSKRSLTILASGSIGILVGGLVAYFSVKRQAQSTKKLVPVVTPSSLINRNVEKHIPYKSKKRVFLQAKARSVQGLGNIFIIFY